MKTLTAYNVYFLPNKNFLENHTFVATYGTELEAFDATKNMLSAAGIAKDKVKLEPVPDSDMRYVTYGSSNHCYAIAKEIKEVEDNGE